MEFSHEELQFAASALGLRAEATWCKWLVSLGISLVRIVILMHDAFSSGTAPSHELKDSLTDFTRFRYNQYIGDKKCQTQQCGGNVQERVVNLPPRSQTFDDL